MYSAYIDNFLNAKDAVRIAKEAKPAFHKFLEVSVGLSHRMSCSVWAAVLVCLYLKTTSLEIYKKKKVRRPDRTEIWHQVLLMFSFLIQMASNLTQGTFFFFRCSGDLEDLKCFHNDRFLLLYIKWSTNPLSKPIQPEHFPSKTQGFF